MLILWVMWVLSRPTCMLNNFFSTLVVMGFRSHDVDNEPKISFLISYSVAHTKTFILDLPSGSCTDGLFRTLSANLEQIVSFVSTKDFKKWSQSDFTTVNSGKAGVGIICRMLFIDFHRRRGLSELSEITALNMPPWCPLMPPHCPLTPSHWTLTLPHRPFKIFCRFIWHWYWPSGWTQITKIFEEMDFSVKIPRKNVKTHVPSCIC